VLRRDPTPRGGFRAPTIVPVIGGLCCAYLLGPWARLEADMIQYKIAAGLLGIGIALWILTRIFYKPEGGHFADIEHMEIDPTDHTR
jgi:APA family basic amino acid/polyamine antiporter